jgi:hypothetical protein
LGDPVETADALLKLAGGPSVLSTATLFAIASATMREKTRSPRKGWLASAAGAGGLVFIIIFLVVSAWHVFRALTAFGGELEPVLLGLVSTWFASLAVTFFALSRTPDVVRYLIESYRPEKRPYVIRQLAKWVSTR